MTLLLVSFILLALIILLNLLIGKPISSMHELTLRQR